MREVNSDSEYYILYGTPSYYLLYEYYVWFSFELSAVNCLSGNNNKKKVQNILPGEGRTSLEIYIRCSRMIRVLVRRTDPSTGLCVKIVFSARHRVHDRKTRSCLHPMRVPMCVCV